MDWVQHCNILSFLFNAALACGVAGVQARSAD